MPTNEKRINIYSKHTLRSHQPAIRMQQRIGTAEEHNALLAKQDTLPLKGEIFFEYVDEEIDDSDEVDVSDVSFNEIIKNTSDTAITDNDETLVAAPHYSVLISSLSDSIETPNLLPQFSSTTVSEDGYRTWKGIIRQTYKTNTGTIGSMKLETPNLVPHAIVKTTKQWEQWAAAGNTLAKGEIALEIIDDNSNNG